MRLRTMTIGLVLFFLGSHAAAQDAKVEPNSRQVVVTLDAGSVSVGEGEGLKTLPVETLSDNVLKGANSAVSHVAGMVTITITTSLSAPAVSQYRLILLRVSKESREVLPGSRAPVLIFFSPKPNVFQTSANLKAGQWALVAGGNAHTLEVR